MSPLPLNVLYYGKQEALPEQYHLRAGPLTATLQNGELLNICWRGVEVLHRIYVALRDSNWGSVSPSLAQPHHQDLDCLKVTFEARHQQDEIDFAWRAIVEATGMDG